MSNKTIEEPPFDNDSLASTLNQDPYAAILICIESRLPIIDVFDDNTGGLCISIIAGNIATPEIIGSLE